MYTCNPIKHVAHAIYSSTHTHLNDVTYKFIPPGDIKAIQKKRRPYEDELRVILFQQTWSSTALGFGGVGGQSMCFADTVVIINNCEACVFFNNKFAYHIDRVNSKFYEHLSCHLMVPVIDHKIYEADGRKRKANNV